jgi:nucleoside 2-deoxyribosyltransferase
MRLYLANPLGFSELWTVGLNLLIDRLSEAFDVYEPFTKTDGDTSRMLYECRSDPTSLSYLNSIIAKNNFTKIDECDILFAVLDGSDVDSGVAAEMGYALAKGKCVFGLRTDIRYSSDNIGCKINLQVLECILSSGGLYFDTIERFEEWLKSKL